MVKARNALFSENGMRIVNVLFFISVVFRVTIIPAYSLWIVYLLFCIKNSSSKASKAAYMVLIAYAAVMLLLNLRFYFQAVM